jgi:hypothetical protein
MLVRATWSTKMHDGSVSTETRTYELDPDRLQLKNLGEPGQFVLDLTATETEVTIRARLANDRIGELPRRPGHDA